MSDEQKVAVTELLLLWNKGDAAALDRLMPLVYNELERRARGFMRRERAGNSLESGALVHECYLRMVDQTRVQWQNRSQFYGVAAQLMRRILLDHAKAKFAAKRGGNVARVTFEDVHRFLGSDPIDVLSLNDAMERLGSRDPDAARVVELRVFGGLSNEETAEVMGVSKSTVKRDWNAARAWLRRELSR